MSYSPVPSNGHVFMMPCMSTCPYRHLVKCYANIGHVHVLYSYYYHFIRVGESAQCFGALTAISIMNKGLLRRCPILYSYLLCFWDILHLVSCTFCINTTCILFYVPSSSLKKYSCVLNAGLVAWRQALRFYNSHYQRMIWRYVVRSDNGIIQFIPYSDEGEDNRHGT